MKSFFKRLFLFILISLTISTGKVSSALAAPAVLTQPSQIAQKMPTSLQFIPDGNILSFNNMGMNVASENHARPDDFMNTNPILPQTDASINATNIIDPVAEWNTFIGGTGRDTGDNMTLDADGNVYVTGSSTATWGNPVQAYNSAYPYNIYIAKLDANGTLIWNTFLGGGVGNAILVDGSGNLYLCGEGGAFAAKLNSSSGALIWRTSLGGIGHNSATDITTDSNGNLYVAGFSTATWGNPVRAHAGDYDAFMVRLNTDGTLIWNTFLGGSKIDVARGLQSDSNGNINIVGFSVGTWGSPVRAFAKNSEIFAAKLGPNAELIWNTFLGGNGDDTGEEISVGGNGNIYLTGISDTTWGSPVRAHGINIAGANYDAFAVKLNSNGTLIWNTFLGGAKSDFGKAITVAADESIYVGGSGNSSAWGSPSRAYNAGSDAFAAKLNTDGMLIWNAFVGAAWYEDANSIAVDGNGTIYLAGMSNKNWGNPVQAFHGGDYDAFVAKFNPPISIKLNSIGADDGWVLESSENSNAGGMLLNVGAIMLGDDANKNQYRGILSFNTGASIPDNATVTGVMLRFKQQGIIGKVNPISTFQGFMVDMKSGFINTLPAMQITDFQTGIAGPYGPFISTPFNNIYHIDLTYGKTNINRLNANNGLTQIRLRFKLDDNNDNIANILYLYSGNAILEENRPQLLITYTLP